MRTPLDVALLPLSLLRELRRTNDLLEVAAGEVEHAGGQAEEANERLATLLARADTAITRMEELVEHSDAALAEMRASLAAAQRVERRLDDVVALGGPIESLASRLERAVGVFQRD